MYIEVAGFLNRAERVWRDIFLTETIDPDATAQKRDCEAVASKKGRDSEEDFLWCWQHRGFW
jgi:hypothetical protein